MNLNKENEKFYDWSPAQENLDDWNSILHKKKDYGKVINLYFTYSFGKFVNT